MRGRKPIPTHLKVLRGNPGHQALRPEREPDYEAAADIPEPPAFLMPVAKDEWRRIATGLYHLGLLTLVDENPLAAYCQAYARWVTAEASLAKMAERDLLTSGSDDQDHRRQRNSEPVGGHRQQSRQRHAPICHRV